MAKLNLSCEEFIEKVQESLEGYKLKDDMTFSMELNAKSYSPEEKVVYLWARETWGMPQIIGAYYPSDKEDGYALSVNRRYVKEGSKKKHDYYKTLKGFLKQLKYVWFKVDDPDLVFAKQPKRRTLSKKLHQRTRRDMDLLPGQSSWAGEIVDQIYARFFPDYPYTKDVFFNGTITWQGDWHQAVTLSYGIELDVFFHAYNNGEISFYFYYKDSRVKNAYAHSDQDPEDFLNYLKGLDGVKFTFPVKVSKRNLQKYFILALAGLLDRAEA